MESQVSAERPHGHVMADIASRMRHLREQARLGQAGSSVLLAGGPAIIHAGGREALTWLIEQGFIHVLFCGNAEPGVEVVLALTLPLVVIWANTVATLVPLLAERFKIDPTVVSAPMITTIVDATGIFMYLALAKTLL
jgi:cation transporter-like permease